MAKEDRSVAASTALIDDVFRRRLSRRAVLTRAAALGLSASAVSAVLFVAGGGDDAVAKESIEGTLVIASGATANTLDPGTIFDGQSILLWRAAYENLVVFKDDTLEIVPHLAESFEMSGDHLTFTFQIRPGIKFIDGEPFDAAAAKLNLERIRALKVGLGYVLDELVSLETPDEMTLVLKLKEPQDAFLSSLAANWSPYMISPKAIADHEKDGDWAQGWLRNNMVGTGPYILESYTQNQQAVFKRNLDYWRGWEGNHVEKVVVRYLTDPSSTRLLLERGEVDIAVYLPDDVVEELDGAPDIVVTDEPSLSTFFLILNSAQGPTADAKVRQAISYGFNYDAWINGTLRGKAEQGRGPVARGLPSFSESTPQYTYDPAKAKQLLAEAGYPGGGFNIKYVYETGYWWKRPAAELFQANMKDLGITVEIQEVSSAAWYAMLSNPETAEHAYGFEWFGSLMARSYDVMSLMFGTAAQGAAGLNWSYYSNPKVDALLEKAVRETDEAKRIAFYREAEKLLVEDPPAIYLMYRNYRIPMRDNVKGFVFNPMYKNAFDLYSIYKA